MSGETGVLEGRKKKEKRIKMTERPCHMEKVTEEPVLDEAQKAPPTSNRKKGGAGFVVLVYVFSTSAILFFPMILYMVSWFVTYGVAFGLFLEVAARLVEAKYLPSAFIWKGLLYVYGVFHMMAEKTVVAQATSEKPENENAVEKPNTEKKDEKSSQKTCDHSVLLALTCLNTICSGMCVILCVVVFSMMMCIPIKI